MNAKILHHSRKESCKDYPHPLIIGQEEMAKNENTIKHKIQSNSVLIKADEDAICWAGKRIITPRLHTTYRYLECHYGNEVAKGQEITNSRLDNSQVFQIRTFPENPK